MSRILMLSITLIIWIIILIPQFMCKMPDFDGEYIFLFFFFFVQAWRHILTKRLIRTLNENKQNKKVKPLFSNKPRKETIPYLRSVQFSCSVVSDSLWPHESQHPRPPCPSQTRGVKSNSCTSSQWCHPDISSSVVPSPPAPNPS